MNYEFQVELSYSEKRTLKIWKTVIIIHGVLLFLMVHVSVGDMILTPYTPWEYYAELIKEVVQDPPVLLTFTAFSVILNLFTIPRLIALYRFIKATVTGERKLKHVLFYILSVICGLLTACLFMSYMLTAHASKPVIYLYPETKTEVNVKLELDGKLTVVYPNYDEVSGWTVTAEPDGTLTDSKGRKYSYLYWEGDINIKPDMDKGFCVKGEDTAAFLEDSLKQLGLTDKEADDFITYWLPMMQGNEYNVITFQTKAYEEVAALHVSPRPDTVIRVNMLWYSSKVKVNIRPQELGSMNPVERKGFTVVEWGGEEYKKGKLLLESMV